MPSPRRRLPLPRLTAALLACIACLGLAGADATAGKPAGKAAKPTRAVKVGGDHRAWNAIKALVPGDVTVVGSVNVNAMRGTATFQKMTQLAGKDGDLREGLAAAKDACGIDVLDAVADVAFAGRESGDPLVAVAFRNVGRAELEKCATAIASKNGQTLTQKSDGKLTRYESGNDTVYVAWLPGDVAVISSGGADKDALAAMLGGKGAFVGKNAGARQAMAAVPASAMLWGVYAKEERLDRYVMKHAAVWAEASAGKVHLEARLIMDSPQSAQQAAADWLRERDQMAAGGAPGALATMVKQLQISSEGDAVRIVFEVSERDLVSLMSLF